MVAAEPLRYKEIPLWDTAFNVHGWDFSKISTYSVPSGSTRSNYYPLTKTQNVRLNPNGIGGALEATSHEIGHMIELAERGKFDRLMLRDYGMKFRSRKKSIKHAIFVAKMELRVICIQAKLMLMAGFGDAEVRTLMDDAIEAVWDTNIVDRYRNSAELNKALETYLPGIFEKAANMDANALKATWQSIVEYLNDQRKQLAKAV